MAEYLHLSAAVHTHEMRSKQSGAMCGNRRYLFDVVFYVALDTSERKFTEAHAFMEKSHISMAVQDASFTVAGGERQYNRSFAA